MQFIKKLVILTGGNLSGTLILEKNSFGVWCKLNIFGEIAGERRLVVISGDELFVMKIEPNKTSVKFELGELDYGQIHVAVINDKVIMYGSNCAEKLSPEFIMRKVRDRDVTALKQESYITFSGQNQKIDDYFKEIAPPQYNDFAIADKNYYPAYVSFAEQDAENNGTDGDIEQNGGKGACENMNLDGQIESKLIQNEESNGVLEQKQDDEAVSAKRQDDFGGAKRELPHKLERRYLSLMTETQFEIKREKPQSKPLAAEQGDCAQERAAEQVAIAKENVRAERKQNLKSYANSTQSRLGRQATYFERSSEQIEKLIATNERYGLVERLIPGSKFVKINYDQKRFYIVGVIGKDYICYGVPGTFSPEPPEPLSGYAKWLPLGQGNQGGEGFWMMYQDGITGETLKN